MYSIKAITLLTGLTAETLRAWERRYASITPARSDNGRRLYSQQDMEKLMLLAELTRSGHTISKIAGLNCEALRDLQQQSKAAHKDSSHPLLDQIIEALMAYRIDRCEQLLKRALVASEPLEYARDILLPALKKVGELWHEEKLSIAQEHMFTCCVNRIVLSMVNNLQNASTNSPTMLFATPSNEPHECGILLSCLLAAVQQYRCFFLGANLPGKDIVEAIHHLQPDIIVIGLVKTPPEPITIEQLQIVITAKETAASTVWIGGDGARYWHPGATLPGCELITDINHFYNKAQQWMLLDKT
ncbi:MAG: MerR family transcriptional regulator [Methylobacter sp.]|uniref:MerR family transcriptional regulator n=1 Tax=Methylobacter sp. TaxID=2051955 RepID=UPI002724FC51|nr:B12-binding domain-containing protein [Methylobacter sp.]MDO9269804.1 MerR family transcriptional regulator [Methylobacter sp.]MDP1667106.1 MerR family transcriptional regulator [Methylobacter sp.]